MRRLRSWLFLEVRVEPHVLQRDHGHQRFARRDALAQLHAALGDEAVDRRDDARCGARDPRVAYAARCGMHGRVVGQRYIESTSARAAAACCCAPGASCARARATASRAWRTSSSATACSASSGSRRAQVLPRRARARVRARRPARRTVRTAPSAGAPGARSGRALPRRAPVPAARRSDPAAAAPGRPRRARCCGPALRRPCRRICEEMRTWLPATYASSVFSRLDNTSQSSSSQAAPSTTKTSAMIDMIRRRLPSPFSASAGTVDACVVVSFTGVPPCSCSRRQGLPGAGRLR